VREEHAVKKYKAIFFDWDGTAVISRKAPVDETVAAMAPLLEQGIKLVIVSGTTIENIAGGKLHEYFTKKQLDNLYLGLARGAYNYTYKDGEPYIFSDRIPDKSTLEAIHRTSFEIHMELKNRYGLDTDIVFSRPNYCKIDLMVGNDRGDALFMQADELTKLKEVLRSHGIEGGLQQLLDISVAAGEKFGIKAAPTCDAKYLEVGTTSKSDNTDAILNELIASYGIKPTECAYFGDEFVGIEPGIFGSDSFMITELSKAGDFYDVSDVSGTRPEGVEHIGGGVERFLSNLKQQL
jgi:hydroxymethylpyrimidine pyrophosphatase-like HAD family hydrolase